MRRTLLVLPIAAVSLLPLGSVPAATESDHCLSRAKITPLEDRTGAVMERNDGVRQVLRFAPPARANEAASLFVIKALAGTWNADDNPVTIRDTITVPAGSQVRWQWVEGFHSITDGHDSGDGGQIFNYFLDAAHPVFDTTLSTPGQLDYFCFVHEGVMHGVINVRGPASVEPGVGAAAASFARPPAPNPSRGQFAFSIALPRETDVTRDGHDASGRAIARPHDGALAAGEHPFSWNGRLANGGAARNGAYFVRLRAGGLTDSRRIVLRR